jgi:hypothetical protein
VTSDISATENIFADYYLMKAAQHSGGELGRFNMEQKCSETIKILARKSASFLLGHRHRMLSSCNNIILSEIQTSVTSDSTFSPFMIKILRRAFHDRILSYLYHTKMTAIGGKASRYTVSYRSYDEQHWVLMNCSIKHGA